MSIMVPDELFVQRVMPQGQQVYNTIDRATPDSFGGQVGQTLNQAGDMLAQDTIRRQQLANEANVSDVYANQFSPAARAILQNYMKLEGKDAEAAFPDYQQQMNDLRDQTRAALPNAMQQKAFDQISTRRVDGDLDGMARYAAAQTKQWEWNSHTAKIADLIDQAAANYNNPDVIKAVANQIDQETYRYGRGRLDVSAGGYVGGHGWSDDVIDYQMIANNDKLLSAVIKRRAQSGDLTGALFLYRDSAAAARLSGSAQGELENFLKPYQDLQAAQNAFGKVTGGATAQAIAAEAQRQGVDPSTALTIWSAEGRALGAPANVDATGGAADQDCLDASRQVQLGVALAKQNSAALSKDLGRQPQPWELYLAHQQGIDGAGTLLRAFYKNPNANAGEIVGNPDAITLNGGTSDMTAGQFVNYIKGYIDKHSQMYTPSGVPTARNVADNYERNMQQLADQARQDAPGDPAAVDRYQSHYAQQAGKIIQAQQMTDRANWNVVNTAMTGPQAFRSKADFLADPTVKAAYDAIYAKNPSVANTVDDVFTKKNLGLWDPAPTPESDNLYSALLGFSRDAPGQFCAMDLHPYYGTMPDSRYNELEKRQQKILDHDDAETQKSVKIISALGNAQDIIGRAQNRVYLDQTPYAGMNKIGGPSGQLQYYKFVGEVEKQIDDFQQNNGKPPNYEQQRQIIGQILFPNGIKEPEAKPEPGQQIDVSKFKPENQDDFSRAIAAELQAGGKIVNDATITAAKALLSAQKGGK